MKTNSKLLISIILTVVYNILFWGESLGVNLLLFSIFIVITLLILYPLSFLNRSVRITLIGTIITGICVVINNSLTSKVGHIVSFITMVGFIHQPFLKTTYYAISQTILSYFKAPEILITEIGKRANRSKKFGATFSYLRLSVMPLVVVIIFYWLYKIANPVFNDLSSTFWDQVLNGLALFFTDFSVLRIPFILAGLLGIIGILFRQEFEGLLDLQFSQKENLLRQKRKSEKVNRALLLNPDDTLKLSMAFKNHLKSGTILLVLVNILLLIVNVIDINWIWINFNPETVADLKQFVHEGTYILIFSILLSILILLYYFQGNINFFSKNKVIKNLSYAWIVQNSILCISVAIRNYHYIVEHGLAYKRIGVIIFLLLTVYGLFSLFLKIRDTKSSYFLYQRNTWALYSMWVIICLFNWDIIITNFNLNHIKREKLSTSFLLTLSDKNLHILQQNEGLFIHKNYNNGSQSDYLKGRISEFTKEYPQRSWLSWNWAEYNTYTNLIKTQTNK